MHVGDAASWATIIGTAIALVALAVAVLTFAMSVRKARGDNQRLLRQRLREQLRQTSAACDLYFHRVPTSVIESPPRYSFQALKEIRQDGILSPNKAHIALLEQVLREIFDRSHVRNDEFRSMVPADEAAQFIETNQQRLDEAFQVLDSRSTEYLDAIGRMDNNKYLTYLKYRFLVPRKR